MHDATCTLLAGDCQIVHHGTRSIPAESRRCHSVTIHVKKRVGMSDPGFIECYNTKHAQNVVRILQQRGILNKVDIHTTWSGTERWSKISS
jgi:hypothetical protein